MKTEYVLTEDGRRMRKVKIHFMSKKDVEHEQWDREFFGKIQCGQKNAYGITWVKSKVDCIKCRELIMRSWLKKRKML